LESVSKSLTSAPSLVAVKAVVDCRILVVVVGVVSESDELLCHFWLAMGLLLLRRAAADSMVSLFDGRRRMTV